MRAQFSLAAAVIACLVVSVGSATAATLITGAQVADGSLTGKDIADRSLPATKIDGTAHLQFKGTYAASSSTSPQSIGLYEGPNDIPDGKTISSATINVPFTGRVMAQATATVQTKSDFADGECWLLVTKAGSSKPVNNPYDAIDSYEATRVYRSGKTNRVDLFTYADVTARGNYTVSIRCGLLHYRMGELPSATATGKVMTWATAN